MLNKSFGTSNSSQIGISPSLSSIVILKLVPLAGFAYDGTSLLLSMSMGVGRSGLPMANRYLTSSLRNRVSIFFVVERSSQTGVSRILASLT